MGIPEWLHAVVDGSVWAHGLLHPTLEAQNNRNRAFQRKPERPSLLSPQLEGELTEIFCLEGTWDLSLSYPATLIVAVSLLQQLRDA